MNLEKIANNLMECGLVKSVFIYSKNTKVIEKSLGRTRLKTPEIINIMLGFHDKYVKISGLDYIFLNMRANGYSLVMVPLTEDVVIFVETERDAPLSLILTEILKENI